MRPFTSTITLDEARARLLGAVVPDRARRDASRSTQAHGRVLARDVAAALDVPSFTRSAMDGYAVLAADTTGRHARSAQAAAPDRTRLHRRSRSGTLAPGDCVEIATGAPVPPSRTRW